MMREPHITDILVTDSGFSAYQPQGQVMLASLDDVPEEVLAQSDAFDDIHIAFASSADGRGFSLARAFREAGFTGRLIATGKLVSDQYRHARQVGFDGVLLSQESADKMPEVHWLEQAARVTQRYADQIFAS